MKYNGSKKHIENVKNAAILGVAKLKEIKLERVVEYNKSSNKCKSCNCDLSYEKKNKKFCSSSCAAKFNNSKRKHSDVTKAKILN